jgi:hypothetical protein
MNMLVQPFAVAHRVVGMRHGTTFLTLPLAAIALLLLVSCGGGSSSPSEPLPPGTGSLLFVDSGCACVPAPYPPIPIYVDGRQAGSLPVFGKLNLPLPPGQHTWSLTANDPNGTPVNIPLGGTVTVNLFTNLDCTDGCDTSSHAAF